MELGNDPFVLAERRSWPALQSLRADAIGARMPIAEVLGSVFNTKSLLSLDVSDNPGIDGAMDADSFSSAGIYNDGVAPFRLILLRMGGTRVAKFQTDTENFFPAARTLSFGDTALFDPEVPIDQQTWLHLEQIDVRGTSSLVRIADPRPYPGTPLAEDLVSNTSSLCATTLIGGVLSRYSIAADPRTYNWSLCQCLENHYGEPWKGCLVCPEVPRGETGVKVDCRTRPGVMNVTGGWMRFGEGAVEVVACPSDSPRSPCAWGALSVTVRNVTEWERAGSSVSRSCVEGYEGRLCSRCKPGFFRSGRSCYRCRGKGLSWLNPLLSLVLLTALGVKSVTGGYKARSGLIRTLTMHAQLVALLPDLSLRLSDWSGFLVKSASSGSGGLRLNGLECEGKGWDGFYGPFVLGGLLPVIVVIGSIWIGLVSGYVGGGRAMGRLDRFKTAGFYLWLVLLFGSMQRLLAPLNCTDHGVDKWEPVSGLCALGCLLWIVVPWFARHERPVGAGLHLWHGWIGAVPPEALRQGNLLHLNVPALALHRRLVLLGGRAAGEEGGAGHGELPDQAQLAGATCDRQRGSDRQPAGAHLAQALFASD